MNANKNKPIIFISLIIFVISLFGTIRFFPSESSNNFICWIILGIHILIIGYLTKLLFPDFSLTLKRLTIVLALFSMYMALGTGLLHYQGEGGYKSGIFQGNIGNEIQYYIHLHNGLNLPINVDCALLFGERGLEKKSSVINKVHKEGLKGDYRIINLTFKVTEQEAALPIKAVVVYRIFRFIPMMNVMELKWPEFSSY